MPESSSLRLDIWKGDWGLPSVDVDCLHILTFIKFANIEVEVRKTCNPFRTPNGKFPVIYYQDKVITDFNALSDLLKTLNKNPDDELDIQQQGEIIAYSNLIREKLYPALLYAWWVDSDNQNKLSRVWFTRAIPFPLNFYYPGKYVREATSTLEALYSNERDLKDIESHLYHEAENCLSIVSGRLGESPYLYGVPTSFDALLFAHIAPILLAPMPSKNFQNRFSEWPNLRAFVNRISQRFYAQDGRDYELKKKEEARKKLEEYSDDYPHALRNKVIAGLFAATTMLLYAASTGIIKGRHR